MVDASSSCETRLEQLVQMDELGNIQSFATCSVFYLFTVHCKEQVVNNQMISESASARRLKHCVIEHWTVVSV